MGEPEGVAGATVEPATERFRRHVGPEAAQRPPPALARAGGGFAALFGAFAVAALGGEVIADGTSRGLAALLAAGYGVGGALLLARGRPSQRTAAVVAVAASVPAFFGFLFLTGHVSRSDPTTVLALSSVAWGTLHVVGPTRGHGALLGAALVGAWLTVAVQIGIGEIAGTFTPFATDAGFVFGTPDTAGVAIASLLFGVVYIVAADGLDQAGLHGTATAFLGAGVLALGAGVLVGTMGRDEWLVGLLLMAAGAFVGFVGARRSRRATTWLGAGAAVAGAIALVSSPVADDQTVAGAIVALFTAVAVVAAVPSLAAGLGEEEGDHADPGHAESAANAPKAHRRPLRTPRRED